MTESSRVPGPMTLGATRGRPFVSGPGLAIRFREGFGNRSYRLRPRPRLTICHGLLTRPGRGLVRLFRPLARLFRRRAPHRHRHRPPVRHRPRHRPPALPYRISPESSRKWSFRHPARRCGNGASERPVLYCGYWATLPLRSSKTRLGGRWGHYGALSGHCPGLNPPAATLAVGGLSGRLFRFPGLNPGSVPR